MMILANLAAVLSLAIAQPSAMPPLPDVEQAPASAGKCIWEKMPAGMQAEILGKPTLGGAYNALSESASSWGNENLAKAGTACGVSDKQFRSAGRRVAGWVGRLWSEKQLAGRLSAQKLDQAYRAIPMADRIVLQDAFGVSGAMGAPQAREAMDRFLVTIGIDRTDNAAFEAALSYVVTRMGDDKDTGAR